MSDMSLRHSPDRRRRKKLEELFDKTNLSTFEMYRNFPVFVPRFNIARFLLHYELFKKIYRIPGVIIDLGVFRGSSTFAWAILCEIFCPMDIRRIVYRFNPFMGFPALSKEDGTRDLAQDRRKGDYFAGQSVEKDLRLAQEAMNHDRHIKLMDRIQFIKGDFRRTIPRFIKRKGNGLRIALMNLDLDLYAPTKSAPEYFVPLTTRGSVIIADKYAVDTYVGETKAIDDYFKKLTGKKPKLKKFTWHSNPSRYIEVDW